MATAPTRATLDDLCRTEGTDELIGGRVVEIMPSGMRLGEVASNIYLHPRNFARTTRGGVATNDSFGYAIRELAAGRESLYPDAAFYSGPLPSETMRFVEGPPTIAVKVLSESDCGPAAELEMANKRNDYFEAGTLAVWDVDPVPEQIGLYTKDKPDRPMVFRRGQPAQAGHAVPRWAVSADNVFATDL